MTTKNADDALMMALVEALRCLDRLDAEADSPQARLAALADAVRRSEARPQ